MMINAGPHLSAAKGYTHMGRTAVAIGANTFQFFMRNPRGARARAYDPDDMAGLRQIMDEHDFAPLVVHAPYTVNPCSKDDGLRALAVRILTEDIERMAMLPESFYNLHPGSHTGRGEAVAVELIAQTLNQVLETPFPNKVLLETMSGKGSEMGSSFEGLRAILDRLTQPERVGICFDACHLYSAGYDIAEHPDDVLEAFDKAIGMERLCAFHLNDSMTPMGSRKDRHAPLGEGSLGWTAITGIVAHPQLRHLPFITETPLDDAGHALELRELKRRLAADKEA